MHFQCDLCGLCCQNLNKSHLYDDLNNGDGVCRYYNKKTQKCNIYEKRPDKCNVDKMYKLYFYQYYDLETYYKKNYEICKILKER